MRDLITQFTNYVADERKFSPRTVRAYEMDLMKFAAFLESRKQMDVKAVTRDDIRAFISELSRNGIKKKNAAVTIARKLSSIKSFFKYLVRFNVLAANPAADVETPKLPHTEPNYLTNKERAALIAAVGCSATPYYLARDMAIVVTLLNTGIRLSELVGLTLNSINLESSESFVKVRGKGDKWRTIPLNNEAIAALRKYLNGRPDVETNHLFVSRLGKGLSTRSVYHLIKRYLKEAGITKEHVGVHSLRHTFSVSLLSNGVNLFSIQKLLGHSKLETTSKYLHVIDADLRDAVNRLVNTQI